MKNCLVNNFAQQDKKNKHMSIAKGPSAARVLIT